jgi:hypothetical protein
MTTPAAIETVAHYENIRLDLLLSDSEYQILKRLHVLATEHITARLSTVTDEFSRPLRGAAENLGNLGLRFEYTDREVEKHVFLQGSDVVFLAQPGDLMVTNPDFSANYEFMRSPGATTFMVKLKDELYKAKGGYSTEFMRSSPAATVRPRTA